MADSEAFGNQIGAAYVNSDLMRDLWVKMIVSLCWPQLEPASDLRIRRRTADLSAMEVMCGVKVRCVSKVTPNIFGRLSSGRGSELFVKTVARVDVVITL